MFVICDPETNEYLSSWKPCVGFQWSKDPMQATRYSSASSAQRDIDYQPLLNNKLWRLGCDVRRIVISTRKVKMK